MANNGMKYQGGTFRMKNLNIVLLFLGLVLVGCSTATENPSATQTAFQEAVIAEVTKLASSNTDTPIPTSTQTHTSTPILSLSPTVTLTPFPTQKEQPSQTPEPSPMVEPSSTIEPSPTIKPLVDVLGILGKSVNEVEGILGSSVWITPNDDFDDNLAGGEYRDYEIGGYVVFVAYDSNGIARVFQILEGLSDENYSIMDWDQILPKFGVLPGSPPDREAQAAVYWDNYDGYFIAVVASSTSGKPVWTVQISEAAYQP